MMRSIKAPINYIDAKIIELQCDNIEAKVFFVRFPKKTFVLSTLEGIRNVDIVGNYYLHSSFWKIYKDTFILKRCFCKKIALRTEDISLLFTSVDMDNIAFHTEIHKDLIIWVAITAGVHGNAIRAGVDKGCWLETENGWIQVGTINILIFTNKKLTDGALASAVISATEAKSAVLQDMQIKSSYTPHVIATGTGTDNIIISSGYSGKFTSAGGHTLIGYMIGKSVRKALTIAISKYHI